MKLISAIQAQKSREDLISKDEQRVIQQLNTIKSKFNKKIDKAIKRNKTSVKFTIKHIANNMYDVAPIMEFRQELKDDGYQVDTISYVYSKNVETLRLFDNRNYTVMIISWD